MSDNVKRMRNGEKNQVSQMRRRIFFCRRCPQKPNVFKCDTCEAAIVLAPAHTREDGILVLKNKEGKRLK